MPNRLSGHFDLGFRTRGAGRAPIESSGAGAGPPLSDQYSRRDTGGFHPPPAPPAAPSPKARLPVLVAAVLGVLVLIGLMLFWLVREPKQSAGPPHTALPIPEDTTISVPGAHPDTVVVRPPARSPVLWLVLGAVGAIVGVGLLALLTAALRRFQNPLPWQLVCWTLLTLGILSRHLLVPSIGGGQAAAETASAPGAAAAASTPQRPAGEPFEVRSLLLSAALGLAVFPYTMRRLNRLRPQPGLEHVALPFGLGFFLDLAQVTALHWVPKIAG
jgi:hypothetical protein